MSGFAELLKVDNLSKKYGNGNGEKWVLRNVSFCQEAGQSLAVLGPSGCGKTTLLLIIAGLLAADDGRVQLEGEPVFRPTSRMALVLQEYGLFPWKTVAENIMLGARLQKIRVSGDELGALKADLGIEGLDQHYPHQLSGGQRQRVALARAMLLQPKLLLLDEPFAALDTMTRERLQNGLLELFNLRRMSFIIVTHNIQEAVFLGQRIIVLDPRTMGIGTVLDNPLVGDPAYRENPEFFRKTLELRRLLEEIA